MNNDVFLRASSYLIKVLNYRNKNVAFLTIEVRDIKIKRHTTKQDNKKGQKFDFCRKPLWFVRRKRIVPRG